jgi:hypothetical protein
MPETRLTCPTCGTVLKLAQEVPPGKKIKCPKCSAVFTMGGEAPPVSAERPASSPARRPASPPPADDDLDFEPPPKRSSRPPARPAADEDDDFDAPPPPRRPPRRPVREEEEEDDLPPPRPQSRRMEDEEDYDDYDRPRRRRRPRRGGQQSGAVTLVAVYSFILGGLYVLCGLGIMILGSAIGSLGFAMSEDMPADNPGADAARAGFAAATAVFIIIGILALIVAFLLIMAGVGVIKRRQWGRILTLVMAALIGVLALIQGWGFVQSLALGAFAPVMWNFLFFALFAGYTIVSYMVLLNSRNAEEFS